MSDARVLAAEAVESHVRAFFEGHSVEVVDYDLGPERREVAPDLRVLVVGPGPRSGSWAYVTAGCWAAMEKDGHGLEFVMTAHVEPPTVGPGCRLSDGRWRSYYDQVWVTSASGLDIDHMVPLAESWDSGASAWSAQRREAYANDQGTDASLVAVTARSNRSKADQLTSASRR